MKANIRLGTQVSITLIFPTTKPKSKNVAHEQEISEKIDRIIEKIEGDKDAA